MRLELTGLNHAIGEHDQSDGTDAERAPAPSAARNGEAGGYGIARLGLVPEPSAGADDPAAIPRVESAAAVLPLPSADAIRSDLPVEDPSAAPEPDDVSRDAPSAPTSAAPASVADAQGDAPAPLHKRGTYKLPTGLIERLRRCARRKNQYQYQLVAEALETYLDVHESDDAPARIVGPADQ